MSTTPRFTVVIPAYQAAATIGEAVMSAACQVPAPEAIVVVDDGSTDDTSEIIRSLPAPVQLVRQPNRGEAAARNAGLRSVRTEWAVFLDADDRFLPGRLEAMGALIADRPNLDLVTTDAFLEIDGEIAGHVYERRWPFAHDRQREEILVRNFIFGHVAVRVAELLRHEGFDETIRHATDWAAWIRMILAGSVVGLVPRPLSVYRLHHASLSADRVGMARGGLAALTHARRNSSLCASERSILEGSIRAQKALVEREQLTASIASGRSSRVRTAARAVLVGRGVAPRLRAKAAVALASPSVARTITRRRRRERLIGTSGRAVPAAGAARASLMPAPLVSAIVPSLGDPAARAVRHQTMGAWELLVTDDALAEPRPCDRVRTVASDQLLGAVRGGTFCVLAATEQLDIGAFERRLLLLAGHCEAGAVVESDVIAPGVYPPPSFGAGLEEAPVARERLDGASILFRSAAVRTTRFSSISDRDVVTVLEELARDHPVIVGPPRD